MVYLRSVVSTFIVALVSCYLFGQKSDAFDLFNSDSIVSVRLTTDMKLLVKEKQDEEYQPAIIEFFLPEGDTIRYDIELRSRGNMRKTVCYFPPIKVKFDKDQFKHNKLKLVISCRDSDLADQLLLKEYIIYKMYEKCSEYYFRTRLMRIEYIDTGRSENVFTRYAFVIEDEDALAERLGGRTYEPKYLKAEVLNQEQLANYTYFQYLIGNTDWHVPNRHNMETIAHEATESVLVIPYDFDYSGFVNTAYAVPNDDIPVRSVTERYNKGYCMSEDLAEEMRIKYLGIQDSIISMCEEFPYFDKASRRDIISYMDEFWALMESDKATRNTFAKDCQPFE